MRSKISLWTFQINFQTDFGLKAIVFILLEESGYCEFLSYHIFCMTETSSFYKGPRGKKIYLF